MAGEISEIAAVTDYGYPARFADRRGWSHTASSIAFLPRSWLTDEQPPMAFNLYWVEAAVFLYPACIGSLGLT